MAFELPEKMQDVFDLLKFEKGEYDYSIIVGDKTLGKIRIKTLNELLVNLIPKEVIAELYEKEKAKEEVKAVKRQLKIDNISPEVKLLAGTYHKMKEEFYGRKNLKVITPKNKEYKFFIQALEIMKNHDSKPKEYINAQLHGMQFINGGKGQFPNPSQLATVAAEDRLLKYRFEKERRNKDGSDFKKEFKKQPITVYDRETSLTENTKFMGYLKLVKDGTASMAQAVFVKELMEEKRGRGKAIPEVYDYLKELQGK